jgi:hypothetical protein
MKARSVLGCPTRSAGKRLEVHVRMATAKTADSGRLRRGGV